LIPPRSETNQKRDPPPASAPSQRLRAARSQARAGGDRSGRRPEGGADPAWPNEARSRPRPGEEYERREDAPNFLLRSRPEAGRRSRGLRSWPGARRSRTPPRGLYGLRSRPQGRATALRSAGPARPLNAWSAARGRRRPAGLLSARWPRLGNRGGRSWREAGRGKGQDRPSAGGRLGSPRTSATSARARATGSRTHPVARSASSKPGRRAQERGGVTEAVTPERSRAGRTARKPSHVRHKCKSKTKTVRARAYCSEALAIRHKCKVQVQNPDAGRKSAEASCRNTTPERSKPSPSERGRIARKPSQSATSARAKPKPSERGCGPFWPGPRRRPERAAGKTKIKTGGGKTKTPRRGPGRLSAWVLGVCPILP